MKNDKILTVKEYMKKYKHMTDVDYKKLKKAELTSIIIEFANSLPNHDTGKIKWTGDPVMVDEVCDKWYRIHFKIKGEYNRFYPVIHTNETYFMGKKKDWLVNYAMVLDMTFNSVYVL